MHHQTTELVDPGLSHFQKVRVKGIYGTHMYTMNLYSIMYTYVHDAYNTITNLVPSPLPQQNAKDGLEKCIHIPSTVTVIGKSRMSNQIIRNNDIVQ